jgi:aryl-alcohol dehydrogenase-like predicted oxidoreductase
MGLGAMPLSLKGRPERPKALRVVRRAVELGVTLIDTADACAIDDADAGHNEVVVAEALRDLGAGFGGSGKVGSVLADPGLNAVAKRVGCAPAELVLATLLHLSPTILPIPGASRVESLDSSVRTAGVRLDASDLVAARGVTPGPACRPPGRPRPQLHRRRPPAPSPRRTPLARTLRRWSD